MAQVPTWNPNDPLFFDWSLGLTFGGFWNSTQIRVHSEENQAGYISLGECGISLLVMDT